MKKEVYKIQQSMAGPQKSKLQKYKELVIGSDKLIDLIKYELIVLFCSWVPGALGIFLRSKLYPLLIGKVGRGVVFGNNVVLRHPGKISIGDNVIIDDNVLIDAKGVDNSGIIIKDEAFIGRNTILSCKGGDIELDIRANIGFNCEIVSSTKVKVGKDNLIAAYCYLVGGGSYKIDRTDIPIAQQFDYEGKGGVILSEDVWLGAHCVILDGVEIGKGSVVAAGAIVNNSIPEFSIAAGVPAKIIKERKQTHNPQADKDKNG